MTKKEAKKILIIKNKPLIREVLSDFYIHLVCKGKIVETISFNSFTDADDFIKII